MTPSTTPATTPYDSTPSHQDSYFGNLNNGREGSPSPSCGYESPFEESQLPTPLRPPRAKGPKRVAFSSGALTRSQAQAFSNGVNSISLDNVVANAEKNPDSKVSIRDRIACYQWTYFAMTMATGGISNALYSLPYQSHWVDGVGIFFCMLNIFLFIMNCVMLSIRFALRPGSFVKSFTDQVESLFIASFVVSMATIMMNICEYGVQNTGYWLLRTMDILFWIYVGLSFVASAGMYLILWSTMIFPVHMMTPVWVFPAYPLLLTAPLAAALIGAADKIGMVSSLNVTALALCAIATQGTGCMIAFLISAAFIYRLMTQKLPRDMQRPGVFISIGPFGFTAAGLARLGSQADILFPPDFLGSENIVDIVRVISVLVSLWLWGLSVWFFLVSVGSLWKYTRPGHSLPFQMTWWSFVFPNTALVVATETMGQLFDSRGLQILACVLTALLILVWIIVFVTMVRCLKRRELLWPKNDK